MDHTLIPKQEFVLLRAARLAMNSRSRRVAIASNDNREIPREQRMRDNKPSRDHARLYISTIDCRLSDIKTPIADEAQNYDARQGIRIG